MDSRAFLGLQPSHNPYRWSLPVEARLCAGGAFLFGGCGLGAAISALEATSGRQVVWATSQYLDFARPGEVLDLDVTISISGHQITQGRVVCHVGNREILTVNAALGDRAFEYSGQWEQMPDVPRPSECPPREYRREVEGSIAEQLEERLVKGRPLDTLPGPPGDGRTIMWARIPRRDRGGRRRDPGGAR